MPTLLELQRAMRASLLDRNDGPAAAMLADNVPVERLNVYRKAFVTAVTKALRLSYPAVHRLVGSDFFEGAAAVFIARQPPRAAYLDDYGAEFPRFLGGFGPAASLEYLADVARLEWAVGAPSDGDHLFRLKTTSDSNRWAVTRAIHALDIEPLDVARLETLAPEDQACVSFVPHPSIGFLRSDYPVDVIWRGGLAGDDAALAAIALKRGPVCLLVERRATGVEVLRLDAAAWHFAHALCEGRPLVDAFAACSGEQAKAECGHETWLAEHLAAGRFIDFRLNSTGISGLVFSLMDKRYIVVFGAGGGRKGYPAGDAYGGTSGEPSRGQSGIASLR